MPEAVRELGINRKQVSGTVRCRSRIYLEMANCLDRAFVEAEDTWDWTAEQTKERAHQTKVEQILPAA